MEFDDLVGRIYEAGFAGERWPAVLDDLSRVADAAGGTLFSMADGGRSRLVSPQAEADAADYFDSGMIRTDVALGRLVAQGHPGFLGDLDLLSRREIECDDVYAAFRSRGFGWGAAARLPLGQAAPWIINLERRFERGPLEPETLARLDRFWPHLVRAATIAGRLSGERAAAAVTAIEGLGLAAAVLAPGGRLVAANALLQAHVPPLLRERRGRLEFVELAPRAALAAVLDGPDCCDGGKTIALSATRERPAMLAHLLPVRGVGREIFHGAAVLLVLVPAVRRTLPQPAAIAGLFDLTPAEARVARAIAAGATIAAIAGDGGLSRETVRTHLKAVLRKTGTARQADLVGLLTQLGVIAYPPDPGTGADGRPSVP